jgi:predicted Zn-dependent protease
LIKRKDLVRALGEHGLADWVLVEREQELATADAKLNRAEQWLRWQIVVHHDAPTGRGSARISIDAADGDADAAVLQAVTLARASVGTAWVTRPPAAPARVQLADPGLVKGNLLIAAGAIVQSLPRPTGVMVEARADVLREHVTVVTHHGLKTGWFATRVGVDATVSTAERFLGVVRQARRLEDLALSPALKAAADDIVLLGKAATVAPGPCSVILRSEALLHDGLGLWGAFASQADAVVERQGLTRYREKSPVAAGANQGAERLSILSDGALDFGLASAPCGDEGDAVRRFALVDRGVAVGLGLTPREGALRGRDPNGGVRNLIVEPGSWTGAIDGTTTRVIDVHRLRSLSIDPYTGDASLEILLGVEYFKGVSTPFASGSLRLDGIAALARAKRSKATVTRGAYSGPEAVLIDGVDLFA